MRRTRLTHACLAALLLFGGWTAAGTLPASASGSPTASTPAAPDSAPASAPAGLVRAVQRDFGLTRAEAERRLDAEHRAASAEPEARSAAGSAYGGSWFDADSGRLTVAVTREAGAPAVREIRSTGAAVRTVEHSARRLDAAKARIDRLDAPPGVSGWSVDPVANTVVVNVVRGERADGGVRRFVREAREAGPVTVRTVAAPARTLAAGTVGGDPYYTGNVRCSIGFSVHGGFVTAGHCGGTGAAVRGWDGSPVGSFRGSSFPGDDYAWVSVGGGWWTVPVVLGWGTIPDQLVRGSSEAPVGASVCRSGSTTRWHCGRVLGRNETVNYREGAVHQMTRTSVCAEPGDSGGSFLSGDQAQGVTSGGWGDCRTGGETWFQPVNEILQRYGLTLHTA